MSASELIKELQEYIDKYGDLPVFIRDKEEYMGEQYDRESFSVFAIEKSFEFFNHEWHDNLKCLIIEPW